MNTKKKLIIVFLSLIVLGGTNFIYYKMCTSSLLWEAGSTFEPEWEVSSTIEKVVVENQPVAIEISGGTAAGLTLGGWGVPSIPSDAYGANSRSSSGIKSRSRRSYSHDYGLNYNLGYSVKENQYDNAGGSGGGGGLIAMSGGRKSGGGSGSGSSSYGGSAGISVSGGTSMTKPFSVPKANDGQTLVNPWSEALNKEDQIVPVSNDICIFALLALLYALMRKLTS